jgi:aspartate-semialdehyde dehydrogenase
MAQAQRVAVVGATGAVGIEMIRCLEERNFPVADLKLLASPRSAGKKLRYRDTEIPVEVSSADAFDGVDIAFFSAGGSISRELGPAAAKRGAVVVDNSSAFRMDPKVPLVVPEINPEAAEGHNGIIANPNCSTIISIMPLWPLHKKSPLKRMIVATYQAASGAGAAAMEELRESTRAAVEGRPFEPKVLPHPYAFNLFSHNSKIDPETGFNEEETKMIKETRKIYGVPDIRITATCVRVPVLRAHAVAISAEFEHPISPEEARDLIQAAPGLRVVDEPETNHFPMPLEASGQDDVLVGRIRRDPSDPAGRSLMLFACGDQLLKGAALNAVQIGELLVK